MYFGKMLFWKCIHEEKKKQRKVVTREYRIGEAIQKLNFGGDFFFFFHRGDRADLSATADWKSLAQQSTTYKCSEMTMVRSRLKNSILLAFLP